jgi:hypothetical protein
MANCLSMGLGLYLAFDGQFVLSIVCLLISSIGFRHLCMEIDKQARRKKKEKRIKPKLEKSKPKKVEKVKEQMSVEAQLRLNKFSIN